MTPSHLTPQDMVAKWRQSTLKERSSYQEHFIDVCRLIGHATPARELVEKHNTWLNPPGASESELKKRTLTNLYNQRPTWLDLAINTFARIDFFWNAALFAIRLRTTQKMAGMYPTGR